MPDWIALPMTTAAQKFSTIDGDLTRLPAHELIYRQLRDLVLFGDLAPGEAVTIQGLSERLGAGMTPVREAIRRLIAEGALEFQGNRRVSVPLLTADNISELIYARQWLDPYLTLRATERASLEDLDWLAGLDDELDRAILRGDLRAYLELNYRFHKRLYEIAQAPILADVADGLWLRFGPSLRVVCGRMGTQNLPDKHKDMLAAMHARDAEAAARAIREDVIQGMEQVRHSLERSGALY
ncbi:transcriptional regulator, GntR family protein [Roseovarius sp. TM1035]|jgi:DNA-binding GntR family transcriptional regulator|uniref:HTH-type transcriptional regulator McbR n=2 Tax=Roseobacteraceae TaxID=2854170 RepID=A0A1V0RP49_9RHOB|nr:HTH-type transcriptional regulator McbR [Roseovarius mucosus]AWZ19880.1 putative regulator PutR for proline utilization, GntR family [Roseovarius sp. AK1035]EDM30359.1 transcriptional regulator, GntR family protein [Roseovarius sp. TM1035]|tara:strand:+ start:6206 stop:6925 length:720 start_codon:yes stop_codon:yes gene_type:complete